MSDLADTRYALVSGMGREEALRMAIRRALALLAAGKPEGAAAELSEALRTKARKRR